MMNECKGVFFSEDLVHILSAGDKVVSIAVLQF